MNSKRPAGAKSSATAKTAQNRRASVQKPAARIPDDTTSTELLLLESTANVGEADLRKVIAQEQEILRKVAGGEPLQRFLEEIKNLISLLRDFTSGAYRNVPFGTIALVGGALSYLLSPVDLIPDFIPGIGLVDDAAVIASCLKLVAYQAEKYREWKAA
jgi:uncharacterized membrane protein YkvA (DUF1232 family)